MFLVLLRVAIGWHFLYEGVDKIGSSIRGGKSFSAEPYLRASAGPFAHYFRGLVPDVDSLDKLDPDKLKSTWKGDVDQIRDHFAFDSEQSDKAKRQLADADTFVDLWFISREFIEKRQKYLAELAAVEAIERSPKPLSYQRERATEKRKSLEVDRRDLIKEIDAKGAALKEGVNKLATSDQIAAAGVYKPPPNGLDWINSMTANGLAAIGFCLMLGLFTRLSALAGVVFLAQVYLSMPPWPGIPLPPQSEGHYLIVNKNLVELVALLALCALPTGQWIGLDALLFGWFRRSRENRHDLDGNLESLEPPAHRTRTVSSRI